MTSEGNMKDQTDKLSSSEAPAKSYPSPRGFHGFEAVEGCPHWHGALPAEGGIPEGRDCGSHSHIHQSQ